MNQLSMFDVVSTMPLDTQAVSCSGCSAKASKAPSKRAHRPKMGDLFAVDAPTGPVDLTVYDWIVVSSSAGKDSLAMLSHVCALAEAQGVLDRVVVVHADLGRVEWKGTAELAEAQAAFFSVRFVKVWRKQGDLLEHIEKVGFFPRSVTRYCTSDPGQSSFVHKRDQIKKAHITLQEETVANHLEPRDSDLLTQIEQRGKFPGPDTRFCTAHHKQNQVQRVFTALTVIQNEAVEADHSTARDGDFLEQVEARGMFPDAKNRYCTSDQKRNQISKLYTALSNKAGEREGKSVAMPKAKRPRVRILSCMGMRAEESSARAKKLPFIEEDHTESNGRRQVDKWLPIHAWTEKEVWGHIDGTGLRDAGLVHFAYGLGMPRLSCCFCIFAPRNALMVAGLHNPELLAEYVRVEKAIGHTFRVNQSLEEIQTALASGERPKEVSTWTM